MKTNALYLGLELRDNSLQLCSQTKLDGNSVGCHPVPKRIKDGVQSLGSHPERDILGSYLKELVPNSLQFRDKLMETLDFSCKHKALKGQVYYKVLTCVNKWLAIGQIYYTTSPPFANCIVYKKWMIFAMVKYLLQNTISPWPS